MSALQDEVQAAVAPLLAPLLEELKQLRVKVEAAYWEEMLSPASAAKDRDMTPGAIRQAMASDPELRRRFVGKGRVLRIKRRDLHEWFASRKVRRRKAG